MQKLKDTKSICPTCYKTLPAVIYEEGGKVFIKKTCPEHGETAEIYWSDAEMYKRVDKYQFVGDGVENPAISKDREDINCPHDCGLCKEHHSHTALANLLITNRCDMRCWYCFLNCGRVGKVFEPDLATIDKMLKTLRNEKPVATKAIQITGGEPTVREDMIEIVKLCKENGFSHIQVNSNGINLGNNPELAKQCRENGVNTVYMSFDGISAQTNPLLEETKRAVENCRKAKLGIVLVPVVVNSVNDHELWGIIQFALDNIDIIRGIDFQPISFVGAAPASQRAKMRITIPELWHKIEAQSGGVIKTSDIYPITAVAPFSQFASAMSGIPELTFTPNAHCGMATYIFKDDEKGIIPVTRFVNVDRLFDFIKKAATEIRGGGKIAKTKVLFKALLEFNKIVDSKKSPKGVDLKSILIDVIKKRDYHSLGVFHYKSLFVGTMHFQDPYNYDIDRVSRCVIHYVTPDEKIIPFCAFNGLPDKYSVKMQNDFGETFEVYEKRTGRKLTNDLYKKIFATEEARQAAAYKAGKRPDEVETEGKTALEVAEKTGGCTGDCTHCGMH
ncbi:MAG: radical SAM protein [Candidatus Micrarchaeota archaeon]